MKSNHIKSPEIKNKYWEHYNEGVKKREAPGIVVRMSLEFDVSPCLIAKMVLQSYFEAADKKIGNVNTYLRDTTLIEDMDLAYEVFLVHLNKLLVQNVVKFSFLVYDVR